MSVARQRLKHGCRSEQWPRESVIRRDAPHLPPLHLIPPHTPLQFLLNLIFMCHLDTPTMPISTFDISRVCQDVALVALTCRHYTANNLTQDILFERHGALQRSINIPDHRRREKTRALFAQNNKFQRDPSLSLGQIWLKLAPMGNAPHLPRTCGSQIMRSDCVITSECRL